MPITATLMQHAHFTTLRLGGDLGPKTRPDLYRACLEAIGQKQTHLTIDLSDVTSIDGPSILLLENLAAQTLDDDGDAILVAPLHTMRLMLSAHPLRTDIHVATSLEEARQMLRELSDLGAGAANAMTEPSA